MFWIVCVSCKSLWHLSISLGQKVTTWSTYPFSRNDFPGRIPPVLPTNHWKKYMQFVLYRYCKPQTHFKRSSSQFRVYCGQRVTSWSTYPISRNDFPGRIDLYQQIITRNTCSLYYIDNVSLKHILNDHPANLEFIVVKRWPPGARTLFLVVIFPVE